MMRLWVIFDCFLFRLCLCAFYSLLQETAPHKYPCSPEWQFLNLRPLPKTQAEILLQIITYRDRFTVEHC